MPWSAHIFVGVPITSVAHAKKILSDNDIEFPKTNNLFKLITNSESVTKDIEVNGNKYSLDFQLVHYEDEWVHQSEKSKSGVEIILGVLFGAALTSRYSPSVIDTDWEHGRSDPFILDLDLLKNILAKVRETFLPEAEIMLMDIFH